MSKEKGLAVKQKTIDAVSQRINKLQQMGEIDFPPYYSPANALRSAWLILQETVDKNHKPVLETCTTVSIYNSLLDMVVQGLNPAKKQGYFIAYGNKLVFQRSYFGSMALARRFAGAKEIWAEVVYKGDEFEYELSHGQKRITKHLQRIENVRPDNIVAAYCVIEFDFSDATRYTEIMTMDQIQKAWAKSKMNPNAETSTHRQFPDQMAKRTVINRACKKFINASSDNALFKKAVNRASEISAEEEVEEEIEQNANKEFIDITPEQEEKKEEQEPVQEKEAAQPIEEQTKPERGTWVEEPGF